MYKASKSSFVYFYLRCIQGAFAGTELALATKLHEFHAQKGSTHSVKFATVSAPVRPA